jgi:hypothetical protein
MDRLLQDLPAATIDYRGIHGLDVVDFAPQANTGAFLDRRSIGG